MKVFRNAVLTLALACGLLAAPITFTGCTSTPTAAYRVTAATYTTVDAAMQAWGDYVAKFHPSVDQERQVAQAYKTWQTASVAVVDASKASVASDPSTKSRIEAAVAASAAALNGLITILGQFGINLNPVAQ